MSLGHCASSLHFKGQRSFYFLVLHSYRACPLSSEELGTVDTNCS